MIRPPFPGMRPPNQGPFYDIRIPPMHHGIPPPYNRMGQNHQRPRMRPNMVQHGAYKPRPQPFRFPDNVHKIQNKSVSLNKLDLTKPWVTEHIKEEFTKKEELLNIANETHNPHDWSLCNEQCEKCEKIYSVARNEYMRKHQDQSHKSHINENNSDNKFVCDTCDRDFQNENEYQLHMKQHIVCNIDGCTFTAHEKIVALHVKTQHSTGLYYKICNLSTPEDIHRWREQRKLKYPTKENVIERQKQQQEMLKRGEKLVKKTRFPVKTRLERIKRKNKFTETKQKKKIKVGTNKTSAIKEHIDWNGSMFPFKGTSEIYKTVTIETKDDFDDGEWEDTNAQTSSKVVFKSGLGALMSAYNSSGESENENDGKLADRNDQGPLEEKISKTPVCSIVEKDKEIIKSVSENNRPKRKRTHFRKSKKLKTSHNQQQTNDSFENKKFIKRKPTLLEKLLENEIRQERNVILQCVRYVVNNNYFR